MKSKEGNAVRPIEQVASLIQRANKSAAIAAYPDLPHLILSPDILYGGDGHLICLFLPMKTELRYPEKLLIRLAASAIALPGNAVFGLVLSNDDLVVRWDRLELCAIERAFHFISSPENIVRACATELERAPGDRGLQLDADTRAQRWQRASELTQTTIAAFTDAPRQQDPRLRKWQDRAATSQPAHEEHARADTWMLGDFPISGRRDIAHIDESLIAVKRFGFTDRGQSVRGLIEAKIASDFIVTKDGALQQKSNCPAVLFAQDIPKSRRDPLKLLRTLTLLGWEIAPLMDNGRGVF